MIEQDQSDKYLIDRYISGDKSILAVLVKKWHKTFCEKAYWILEDRELSKDVAQEAWIVIINKLPALKNAESFKSWALRIIYTKSIDALKKRKKDRIHLGEVEMKHTSFSPEEEDRGVLKKKLLGAIKDLPREKQDILRLFYVESYSLKEISDFLKVPIGTVKSRLFKSREKLKSKIKT